MGKHNGKSRSTQGTKVGAALTKRNKVGHVMLSSCRGINSRAGAAWTRCVQRICCMDVS
jgi:hypothetical protein